MIRGREAIRSAAAGAMLAFASGASGATRAARGSRPEGTKLELGVAKLRGRRDIGDSQTFRYAQLRLGMSY